MLLGLHLHLQLELGLLLPKLLLLLRGLLSMQRRIELQLLRILVHRWILALTLLLQLHALLALLLLLLLFKLLMRRQTCLRLFVPTAFFAVCAGNERCILGNE